MSNDDEVEIDLLEIFYALKKENPSGTDGCSCQEAVLQQHIHSF